MEKIGAKRKVAVFDIDGTIFRSSLLIELVNELVAKKCFPEKAIKEFKNEFDAWRDRTGTYEDYIMAIVRTYEKYIPGTKHHIFMKCVRKVIKNQYAHVYRYPRELITTLNESGYCLIAISLSPREIVEEFGSKMGFHISYGRDFEVSERGIITGRVTNLEFMSDKAKALRCIVERNNLTLAGSIGCGDTESDIRFLEIITNPICFNPNQNLLNHAKQFGWTIVVERKDVIYHI